MGMRIDPLRQADMDVPPEPSPGNHPVGGQGDPPPSGDDKLGDKGQGRTLENVRGEVLRKVEESNAAMRAELAEIKGMLRTAAPVAPESQPTDINKMNSTQLEALRAQVPEAHHAELDRLINKRKIEEAVAQGIDQRLSARELEDNRRKANELAYQRWPELRDTNSTLRQVTNEVLREMGAAASNPRAVLDAANEAGLKLGLKPAQTVFGGEGVRTPRRARGNGGEPIPDVETLEMTDAEASAIAVRLQRAMPGGKFTPEQLKRAQKRSGDYRKHQDLIIKK